MIQIRRAGERGGFEGDWLVARHTFSFAEYHDPDHMGFRALRVLNEDRVRAGRGFGMHGHRDMEILTYLLAGQLEHSDSMGNGSVLRPGDVQRMTAGSGVRHSEVNPSPDEELHLLQIWILPEQQGLEPGYEETHFATERLANRLCLIASRDAREGSLRIHQDVDVFASKLAQGTALSHAVEPGRHLWLQVARGALRLGGEELEAGDGASFSEEAGLEVEAAKDAELLLFDLA